MTRKPAIPLEATAIVVRMYEAGFTSSEIAKVAGCGSNTVRALLHKCNVKIRGRVEVQLQRPRRRLPITAVLLKHGHGLSARQIAREFGYHHSTVSRHLLRAAAERKHLPANQHGDQNKNWNGGRVVNEDGYVAIRRPDHPRAGSTGYVLEHVLVAETKLGRMLRDGEVVHHVDRDRANNHPDNLIVYSSHSEHIRVEHTKQDRDYE